jgi:chromosome partitioning protein
MRRIAFTNEKGGTCKTTLAVHLSAYFAQQGQRVLLVDLDTQGHAGKSVGFDVRAVTPNVFHWLSDPAISLSDVARSTAIPNLTIIPSNKDMSEFPLAVAHDDRRVHRLFDQLEKPETRAFDAIVFDSPPSMSLTTLNILMAANEIIIPVALTYLAMDGCAEVVGTVKKISEQFAKPDLRVSMVVPTLYRKTSMAEEILNKLGEYFPGKLSAPLGFNVKIDEAQSHGKTIWEYAPKSKGAEMLHTIAEQIDLAGRATDALIARVA